MEIGKEKITLLLLLLLCVFPIFTHIVNANPQGNPGIQPLNYDDDEPQYEIYKTRIYVKRNIHWGLVTLAHINNSASSTVMHYSRTHSWTVYCSCQIASPLSPSTYKSTFSSSSTGTITVSCGWSETITQTISITVAPNSYVILKAGTAGRKEKWKIELVNTYTGEVIQTWYDIVKLAEAPYYETVEI